jgi:hypothetical protein
MQHVQFLNSETHIVGCYELFLAKLHTAPGPGYETHGTRLPTIVQ